MADTDSTLSQQRGLRPWKPGQSGNPKGRPRGTRNKLGEQFISDVYWEWQKNGADAIKRMRRTDPSGFVRLVASIVPKDLPIKDNPLADWSDDELDEALEMIRASVAEENTKKTGNGK